ncbi:hypothetical protein NLX67_17860 [Domibacillus sp. A3M-37]|uniref:hypothetical protein n=1 Tax=Domibacillus sp. A3M-37 TaxID=2962037 RepID=UPI0020B7ED79|nr:hypothetical protein [Domibacillus sp. A3M-37]MCP3764214.1 hypothetical protein [Domibacillus sp. A3M-37]
MMRREPFLSISAAEKLTGEILGVMELIQACGKTDAVQLMAGRRLFETYLN